MAADDQLDRRIADWKDIGEFVDELVARVEKLEALRVTYAWLPGEYAVLEIGSTCYSVHPDVVAEVERLKALAEELEDDIARKERLAWKPGVAVHREIPGEGVYAVAMPVANHLDELVAEVRRLRATVRELEAALSELPKPGVVRDAAYEHAAKEMDSRASWGGGEAAAAIRGLKDE